MPTKQTYSIGKIKQLIDLNGETTNFDINFRVTSMKKEPFDLVVVDQTTLDNSSSLEYKRVETGTISGTVLHDKGVYQNYFLVLKSDVPCQCEVEIEKKEIPKKPEPPVQTIPAPVHPSTVSKHESYNWKKIFLIIGAIGCIGLAIYYYTKKDGTPTVNNQTGVIRDAPERNFNFRSSSSHSPAPRNNLLDRLKRLNVD